MSLTFSAEGPEVDPAVLRSPRLSGRAGIVRGWARSDVCICAVARVVPPSAARGAVRLRPRTMTRWSASRGFSIVPLLVLAPTSVALGPPGCGVTTGPKGCCKGRTSWAPTVTGTSWSKRRCRRRQAIGRSSVPSRQKGWKRGASVDDSTAAWGTPVVLAKPCDENDSACGPLSRRAGGCAVQRVAGLASDSASHIRGNYGVLRLQPALLDAGGGWLSAWPARFSVPSYPTWPCGYLYRTRARLIGARPGDHVRLRASE